MPSQPPISNRALPFSSGTALWADTPVQECREVWILTKGETVILQPIQASQERQPTQSRLEAFPPFPSLSCTDPLAEQDMLQDPLPRQRACGRRRRQEFSVLTCCRTAVPGCLFQHVLVQTQPRPKALQTVSLGKRRTLNQSVRGGKSMQKKDKLIENKISKAKR